jgi:3-methyladenine DNA glycosylase AlkD
MIKSKRETAAFDDVITELKANASSSAIRGMAKFGINPTNTLGVSIPKLRGIGKRIGRDHDLALRLWDSGIHEARILASLVDNPEQVDEEQMDRWVENFDSWDICDQVCSNLFDKTVLAHRKAKEWAGREEEYVKRAGFVLMATLAVHDKSAGNRDFEVFFPLIKAKSTDERNFVRKAVNWALRQIGKRNLALNRKAIALAKEIQKLDSRSARWVASDALRELNDEKTIIRLRTRER